MKKSHFIILSIIIMIFTIPGCNEPEGDNPGEVVVNFLNAVMAEDYAKAKSYYIENLDSVPTFRNKLEDISPTVANELFHKISDFNYTTKKVTLDPNDSNKAYVTISMQYYDLTTVYTKIFTDYLKTDIEMTLDGSSDEEITKETEDTLLSSLNSCPLGYYKTIVLSLSKTDKVWKLDRISENKEFLDALSGNIISAIEEFQTN